MPRNAAIEILCGGQKRGTHRPATRAAKHIIWYEKEGHAPLFFVYRFLRRRGAQTLYRRAFSSLPPAAFICAHARYASRLPLSFVRTPVTRAACRFHLYARPLREPPAALCRAVHSPPVRSAADLLVNVVLVAVGIRLHAHVIALRRAAAAHADADDLFAAHRFALEIENTAFAAFAGSHF